MLLTPGECQVLKAIRVLIEEPANADDIDYDDEGTPWVKVPEQAVSDRLLTEVNLSYSEARTIKSLNG